MLGFVVPRPSVVRSRVGQQAFDTALGVRINGMLKKVARFASTRACSFLFQFAGKNNIRTSDKRMNTCRYLGVQQ